MQVHLLDMGDEKYGDAIVIVEGNRKILVDGAHIRDYEQRYSAPSIPAQLADVLGAAPPFRFDLLVVTHCHGDHIGCLPSLVERRIIETEWALVAHEDLGYPPTNGQDADSDPVIDKVVAGLREEPRADFRSDAELDVFLTDAANLEQRYRDMIATLEDRSTRVIRYAGNDDAETAAELQALTADFADFGLKILGPNQSHVLRCTDAIANFVRLAKRAARSRRRVDDTNDAVAIYRSLAVMQRPTDGPIPDDIAQFLDRPGKGAALNDQSIVLKFGSGADAVLLTGDMQLAAAEISGLDDLMAALLQDVVDEGPYAFVKLAHHGSYNGFDERVLAGLAGAKVFGVTTGRGDPGHPHKDVLRLLKSVRDRSRLVRTDKNGLISLDVRNGAVNIETSRGRVNDFTVNREDVALTAEALTAETAAVRTQPAGGQIASRPRSAVTAESESGAVEIRARIPHVSTRVTITIDVEPRPTLDISFDQPGDLRKPPSTTERVVEDRPAPLAAGRKLPRLLFITHRAKLVDNIGEMEAQRALRIVESAGRPVVDIKNYDEPFAEVQAALRANNAEGVVILGGYDVLKALRYDTLPPDIRRNLDDPGADPDEFIVWSDQAYGDCDGDMLGEIPVSRIPDGRSGELVRNALCTCSANPSAQRFGLRNYARPFADGIFQTIAGPQAIMSSAPTRRTDVRASDVDASAIYIMLHGSDSDTTRFWGEAERGGTIEALHVTNIPNPCGGTVLAGCCWGALTVRTPAGRYNPGDPVQSLVPEQSIALSFLSRGARAFVGCTGAHYSPVDDDPAASLDYFGAPLHAAFWSHLFTEQEPPARALFNAKMDYIRDMPHGRDSVEERAIEYKILRQFTCLGLGW